MVRQSPPFTAVDALTVQINLYKVRPDFILYQEQTASAALEVCLDAQAGLSEQARISRARRAFTFPTADGATEFVPLSEDEARLILRVVDSGKVCR